MNNVRIFKVDWYSGAPIITGGGYQLAYQGDDMSNMVIFDKAPNLDNYYLLVKMKLDEADTEPTVLPYIRLEGPYWVVPNYYTQIAQTITFQCCCRTPQGDYEHHSALFTGAILPTIKHNGDPIDQSPMFDPYIDILDKRVNELVVAAGDVVIDSELNENSGNPVQNKVVARSVADLNGRLEELEQTGGSGANVPTEVRQALYRLFNNTAFDSDAGFTSDIAVLQSWAMEITSITLNQSAISISGSATSQLTAVTVPAGGLVTWSSSNPAVATVSSTGLVTGVSNGTARIIASCGGKNATCDVTVSGFATLTSITATFTQSGAVYDTDTLDSLKSNLVVTANYDNSTSESVSDYTLSGTLTEGTSTITASYGGFTDTFNVTVTSETTEIPITWTGSGTVFNTGTVDARNADVYFSLPFVEGDSNLVSGATSDTVPVQIRVNVYDSADSTTAYGFYYIDTETKVTTARTWAKSPNLPWNTELKIIPAGDFIKVQVNKPNSAPFTSNSACMAYLNAHGTTLKLRAAGGA